MANVWQMALVTPGFLYALVLAWNTLQTILRVPSLPTDAAPTKPSPLRISIIVPACNEGSTLERGLSSKLSSAYPNFEIVVVNDRSTDDTGAIADAMAARDPRIRVVHVTELPEGWLGKLHALHRGAQAATGDLLLFSDADVFFSRDLLAKTAHVLEAEKLDFLTVTPRITSSGPIVDAGLTTFLRVIITLGRIWKTPDPRSRVAAGAGLFNLVRRSAFEKSPGFEWLRMEVSDDVVFGQMMKRSGARCAVYNGRDDVSLSYYESAGELIKGLEKNSYAASSYRPEIALSLLFVMTIMEITPALLLLVVSGPALPLAAAAVALGVATQVAVAKWCGRPVLTAAIPLFGFLLLLYISLRAVFLVHARGGISWRGTFYSLAELRRGTRLERV